MKDYSFLKKLALTEQLRSFHSVLEYGLRVRVTSYEKQVRIFYSLDAGNEEHL